MPIDFQDFIFGCQVMPDKLDFLLVPSVPITFLLGRTEIRLSQSIALYWALSRVMRPEQRVFPECKNIFLRHITWLAGHILSFTNLSLFKQMPIRS